MELAIIVLLNFDNLHCFAMTRLAKVQTGLSRYQRAADIVLDISMMSRYSGATYNYPYVLLTHGF